MCIFCLQVGFPHIRMPGLDSNRCSSEAALYKSKPQACSRLPGLPTPRLHGHSGNKLTGYIFPPGQVDHACSPSILQCTTILFYTGHMITVSLGPLSDASCFSKHDVLSLSSSWANGTKEIIWATIPKESQNKVSPSHTYFFFLCFLPSFEKM